MKRKIGLFILVFVMFLLMPIKVSAIQTGGRCDDYKAYKWYGYTLVVDGEEKNVSVSGNEPISDYFNTRFANGEIDTKGVTSIWLFFSGNNHKQYSSRASVSIFKKIQCTGKVSEIEGAIVDPPGGDGDQGTQDVIGTYHCSDLQQTELYTKILKPAYKYIRISVPCLLVILCSFDFMSAVTANDSDKMKKAQKNMVRRLAVGLVLLFLPTALNAFLDLVGQYSTCGVGF